MVKILLIMVVIALVIALFGILSILDSLCHGQSEDE